MKTQVAGVLLVVVFLASAHEARAYSSGVVDADAACSACHTAGHAPTVSVKAVANATEVRPGTITIKSGERATLQLEITTVHNSNAGYRIAGESGLVLTPGRGTASTQNGLLLSRAPLADVRGRYAIPFDVSTATSGCTSPKRLRISVVSGNKDRSPTGDGTKAMDLMLNVECPTPSAKAGVFATDSGLKNVVRPEMAPDKPLANVDVAQMAVLGQPLSAPVTLSANRPSVTDVARLEVADPATVRLSFLQGTGHVVVDCAIAGESQVRFEINGGTVHSSLQVPVIEGHAAVVVPRARQRRSITVSVQSGSGNLRLQSCELLPVR